MSLSHGPQAVQPSRLHYDLYRQSAAALGDVKAAKSRRQDEHTAASTADEPVASHDRQTEHDGMPRAINHGSDRADESESFRILHGLTNENIMNLHFYVQYLQYRRTLISTNQPNIVSNTGANGNALLLND